MPTFVPSDAPAAADVVPARLVSPIGGLVAWVRPPAQGGGPDGWLGRFVRIASAGRGRHPDQTGPLVSAGVGYDAASAGDDAICRVAARYASSAWDPAALRWASADELGDEAIAVEELPRVGALEARDRIRWVEGFALDDGRPMWLPAVLAFSGLAPAVEAEAFWGDSDSGLAVGAGLGEAVRAGLLDCVARDALAVTAVMDYPRPRLGHDFGPAVSLFDATSDVGLPVTIASGAEMVGWASGASLGAAATGAVDDLVRKTAQSDSTWTVAPTPTDDEPLLAADAPPPVALDKPALVGHLRRVAAAGYAVDLTTDELADVGLAAVRVVVPGLSPLPPAGDWTDHPRLQYPSGAEGVA